jgi:hypothetical protein
MQWEYRICRGLVTLFVMAAAACALVINRMDSYALFALGIIGLYLGFRYGFGRGLLSREKWFVWLGAIYVAVAIVAYVNGVQTSLGFRVLGRYLRFLVLIPAYVAMRRAAPPRVAVWFALVAGALIAAASGLFQYFASHGTIRAAGDSISITFGDLALMTGFAAAVLTPRIEGRWRWPALAFGLAGLAGGLTASILSGTRGGWLAIPVFGALTFFALTPGLAMRARASIGAGALAIAIAVVATPATGMWPRIDAAWASFDHYFHYRDVVGEQVDVHCVSDPAWLRGLARSSTGRRLEVKVVHDAAALESAGFGARCGGGAVLHFVNDTNHGGWARIARLVSHFDLPGFARVVARGEGRVRLPGLDARRVREKEYRIVTIMGSVEPWQKYTALRVDVPAHDEMWLVPLEVNPGAYRWFYTATSVGTRLTMWSTAWNIFTKHWLLGVGTGAWRETAAEWVDAGRASPVSAMYDHPHNQFLSALANRGVIGFLALLALFGFPAWTFAAHFNSGNEAARASAFAGMISVAGLAIFALTDTILNHSLVIDYYVVFVGVFAALMYASRENDTLTRFDEPGRT